MRAEVFRCLGYREESPRLSSTGATTRIAGDLILLLGVRKEGSLYLERGRGRLDGLLGFLDFLLVLNGEQQEVAEGMAAVIALPRE